MSLRARWARFLRYGLEPLPKDADAAAREARREELRGLRRRRLRRGAAWSGAGSVLLLLLVGALLWWLLDTLAGRDFLLARIQGRLPPGTTLSWSRAEGPASGPLVLHDVRLVHRGCPDKAGRPVAYPACAQPLVTTFAARRLLVDTALRPLIGRTLRLNALVVEGASLDLPRDDAPFELPRWPQSLPQIDPPLALVADRIDVTGLRVTRVGAPLIDIARIEGGLRARTGELHLRRVRIDSDRGRFALHGDYLPADDYRMDLLVTAVLPAGVGTPPALGLVARGDLAAMDIAIAGRAPAPLRALLHLRGRDTPRWTLQARSDALDPGLFAPGGQAGTPLALDVKAEGVGGAATLQGRIERDGVAAVIQPSRLTVQEQVLQAHPLVVDVLGGRITANGRADFSVPERAGYGFAVNARGLHWGEGAEKIVADADARIAGVRTQWTVRGNGALQREGQTARLSLDGVGNAEALQLRALQVRMPTGVLDARGRVAWSPGVGWELKADLAGFDPGYFLSAWPGSVHGALTSTGRPLAGGGMDIVVDARRLGGRLRGRALGGEGRLALRTPATAAGDTDVSGEIALSLGASRIDARGRIARDIDVDARLTPLHLQDLLPSGAGTLQGTLQLRGPRRAPDLAVDLSGSGVRWQDYRVDALTARGRLPWRGDGGQLQVDARGVQAGMALDRLHVDARGAVEQLRLEADAAGAPGALRLSGAARRGAAGWQGTLATLALTPARGARWQLQAPAQFAQRGAEWALSRSCFASSSGGSLCATADWPRSGVQVQGSGVPLALATAYLPPRENGEQWLLRGEADLQAQVRPLGTSWQGTATLTSDAGGLRFRAGEKELVSYQGLRLVTQFDPRQVRAQLGSAFNDGGRIDADVTTGWDAYAPLSGRVAIDTRELTWMELLSPDIVDPQGRIAGTITLGGLRGQPSLGGDARLEGFRAEIPALALQIVNGQAQMQARADGTARIVGALQSGQGTLAIDGTVGWRGGDAPIVLNVRGRDVLASDTRDLRAVIAPDLTVRIRGGEPLEVTGRVEVTSAMIDLERLERGVSASPDVVVLDPANPRTRVAQTLLMDLTLAMGDDVRLRGFGLDGTLTGNLRARARPGRETTGTGQLDIEGRYRAYGQRLQITRGRLSWSNAPIATPILDVRAEREVGNVTAGISVTGPADAPEARVWSRPEASPSEALAYLTLGRPLGTLTGSEARDINAASAALTAGGSLLASQLGSRIGLDDAGVMESRALGGSVFGIGKYLSPRLYMSYGVSLLGTGQVLMLKYMLRRGFDMQIESSTSETRGSVNWRLER